MSNNWTLCPASGLKRNPWYGLMMIERYYDHPYQFFLGILPDIIIVRVNGTSYKKIEELAEQR